MSHGHAEALAPMVERVMGGVEGGFGSIGRIAVASGRVRSRVSGSAWRWRARWRSRWRSLSSASPPSRPSPGRCLPRRGPGVIASAIDAKHGQVYFQLFDSSGRPLIPPRVASCARRCAAIGGGARASCRQCGNAPGRGGAARRRRIRRLGSRGLSRHRRDRAHGRGRRSRKSRRRTLYIKAPDAHPCVAATQSPASTAEAGEAMAFWQRRHMPSLLIGRCGPNMPKNARPSMPPGSPIPGPRRNSPRCWRALRRSEPLRLIRQVSVCAASRFLAWLWMRRKS